eukprot:TRINITY_DN24100_c0_g1_i1.p1 TRINITY_DN24100_c0_g1~~TRINITY_DN24100_c0_g1_i1.p1  ORF type:complete len:758 (+),score=206.01 TRINITY_DN24100_c0_g1_i1:76-2349(+)
MAHASAMDQSMNSSGLSGGHASHTMMASDSEDEESIHSAVSNIEDLEDFEEDEDVDYLALELLHHLPTDKANKLIKSLRAKEKAVQDLLGRNRSLLNSCNTLDQENQDLSTQLKEASDAAEAAATSSKEAAAVPQTAPKPEVTVDTSIFEQMQGGKDEKIRKLTYENQQMLQQVKRFSEAMGQMEEALVQTRKELKKAQSRENQSRAASASDAPPRPRDAAMDEEERIYRELQGETMHDLVMQKFQQKQAENRTKIQAALQALLNEDVSRIERWESDVKGVLLAVDGLEATFKGVAKNTGKKAGKANAANDQKASDCKPLSSDEINAVAAELLDEIDAARSKLENVQKNHLALEQTSRAVFDGAESHAAALDLDSGMATAESEADWIREHNASWVARAQSVSLKPMAEVLERTDQAVSSLLASAPPGLIPQHVDSCLRETRQHFAELAGQIQAQSSSIEQLQEESVSLGRRVKALQAAQRSHRTELRQKLTEELVRTSKSLDFPLEAMREHLRHQSEALDKTRALMSKALEDLAASARRNASASSGLGAAAGEQVPDSFKELALGEIRQVRSMGKSLVANLEEGCRAVELRMRQVVDVVAGEPPPSGNAKSRHPTAGDVAKDGVAEGKKKRNKKKSSAGGGCSVAGYPATGDASPRNFAASSPPAEADASRPAALDEDATLRAEFTEACHVSASAKKKSAALAAVQGSPSKLSGKNLLQELQSLKSEEEALAERMASRMQGGPALAAKARSRKKMYA